MSPVRSSASSSPLMMRGLTHYGGSCHLAPDNVVQRMLVKHLLSVEYVPGVEVVSDLPDGVWQIAC